MRSSTEARAPWYYIPTLYFQQGIPVILAQQVSVLLYKRMGIANDRIGLWTSLIAWPWILKMLWSPYVDLHSTKRSWVLWMQLGVIAGLAGVALSLSRSSFLPLSLAFFAVVAFFSATHDVALDGYYLFALNPEEQAFFVGIRSTFFRLAMVFGSGGLVILAGLWERSGTAISTSWQRALWVGVAAYALCTVYALWAMPRVSSDRAAPKESFVEVLRSFFTQPGACAIVAFFLLYRFGESMLTKVSGLFLLDPHAAGGLGLDTVQVGAILGNVGVVSLVAGGLLGGILISRIGLRKSLWPMALVMNFPNLLYLWAASAQPGAGAMYFVTAIEQFSYGFGMASYLVYAMEISRRSRFQTSHYAVTAALMAAGAMLAGIASGYLQVRLGYFWLFVLICASTVPGMLLLELIPLERESGELVSAGLD